MHEISLGYTIEDYLSGRRIEATAYEDIRQAIVKMLVERKGYPAQNFKTKAQVRYPIDGREFSGVLDLVVFSGEGEPLLVLIFCAGEPETYIRQTVAGARLLPGGPPKFVVVTDTQKALLLQVADGRLLQEFGYQALPDWERLQALAAEAPQYTLTPERRTVEERLFYAFSQLSCSCSDQACDLG
ncbi:MAG: type I restriction enzyme HsdR N-terminal domain-containing protein [Desulfohalobiaceae bacterium]|nr:type I restriction enzyme HsdR N-terminal domain-containing protein [Desulfohalobiaceae bacterium]